MAGGTQLRPPHTTVPIGGLVLPTGHWWLPQGGRHDLVNNFIV